jgi:hypothetical protein
MRVTVIKDDGVVGVDGVFRTVDLSAMPDGVRVMQWDGDTGHSEYYDDQTANTALDTISGIQAFIDLWNAAAPPAPPAPTSADLIAAAHARISTSYDTSVNTMTQGYPSEEIASWPKQETEARAWLLDSSSPTPWIDGAVIGRGIVKPDLVSKIIQNADAFAPVHGELTGKRQMLRDQIDALGTTPTQAQLDAIQW